MSNQDDHFQTIQNFTILCLGLTEVRKGECRADNNSDASGRGCPAEQEYVCAAVYQPVCGSDGNTYSNDCKLSIAQMCNPRKNH